jgi:YVTN family beta-propeller protein
VIYNQFLSIVNTSNNASINAGAVLHLARIEAAASTPSRTRKSLFRSAVQTARSISAPASRLTSRHEFRSALRSLSGIALAALVLVFTTGCENAYRPVVSAVNPVGPAAQPQKFAVVISNPGPSVPNGPDNPGLVTFVDYSGDTVLITANVGVDPYYLILNATTTAATSTTGYTLNGDGTLTSFDISTSLLTSEILQSTLLNNNGILPTSLFPQSTFTYVTQPGRNSVAEFQATPLNLQQELPINPAYAPVFVAGVSGAPRSYVLSTANNGGPGLVNTLENTTTATIDPTPIPVGRKPVYGVMTADGRRVFVMNETDGTVSVINAQTNLLDTLPSGATNPITVGTNPLWADFAPTRNELVVANQGNGTSPGSVSIISIPLCTATAVPTNPNCDPNNPVDSTGFGTVLATVPVGVNPQMVGVLQDGTQAFVVNQGNTSVPCGPATATQPANCSVSVINLTSNTVIATIPLVTTPVTSTTAVANGHPNYIAVTTGTPTGKVYVTSPESEFMTVIRTDTDAVDTTIPLQGKGISVRVTAP